MFERVELDNQKKIPNPSPMNGGHIPVENADGDIQIPIKKGAVSSMEFPAPPPQKADLKKIPGRKKVWLILSIVLAVVVVGAGGVFAAYKQGYIDIPFLNKIFLNEDVLSATVDDVFDIESGKVESSFVVAIEPKTEEAVSIGLPEGSSPAYEEFINEFADGLAPTDLLIEGVFSSFIGKPKSDDSLPNAEVALAGKYTASGTTFEVDFEGRVKDGETYFKINKFPTLFFFDLSALMNTWITVPEDIDDLDSVSGVLPYYTDSISNVDEVAGSETAGEIKEIFSRFVIQSIENEFITIDRKFPAERVDGKLFDKYALSIHIDKLADSIIATQGDMKEYCNTSECTSGFTDQPESDIRKMAQELLESDEAAQQLLESIRYMLWVGRDGGTYKLEMEMIIAFPESSAKLSEKQLRVSVDLSLSEINNEPSVEKPKDVIDFENVGRIMAGLTEEQWKYQQQIEAISSIRSALEVYYRKYAVYPETLDELKIPDPLNNSDDSANRAVRLAQVAIDELPLEVTENNLFLSYSLDEIPLDAYTGEPFSYKKTDDNYTITYSLVSDDAPEDVYSYSSNTKYANGTNTADKYVVSREAIWDTDDDEDGLTGKEEYDAGTDPTKKDTDADLSSDFDEIQAGTDPLDKNSKPKSTTTSATPIILQAPIVVGSLNPNTGDSNGGTVITIGAIGASEDSEVYFGDRRAFVVSATDATVDVILPGYSDTLTTGERILVTVRVVTSEGEDTLVNAFTYTGSLHIDDDNDGLSNKEEIGIGTSTTLSDSDQDGASDYDEVQIGRNPLDRNDKDSDGDGLTDDEEALYGTDPNKRDTDSDGYMDKNEIDAGFNPLSSSAVKSYGMRIDDDDWIRGAENAPVTLVVFGDYECPSCLSLHENTLSQLLIDYAPSVRIVYKHLPLSIHTNAETAAEAAECAGKQNKFTEMHDAMFESNSVLTIANLKSIATSLSLDATTFDACLDNGDTEELVQEDIDYAELLGISGTPATYINGDFISGNQPYSIFKSKIDGILGISG